MPLLAFYFPLMLLTQAWPLMIGPYDEWSQCASVREYLDRRGYETGACELLPTSQDATHLNVIDLP
jgi:hypothetical protein